MGNGVGRAQWNSVVLLGLGDNRALETWIFAKLQTLVASSSAVPGHDRLVLLIIRISERECF